MLYDGVKVYASHRDKHFTDLPFNTHRIAIIILHTATTDALIRMLTTLGNSERNIYVVIPFESDFDRSLIENYPNINWIVYEKPEDRITMTMVASRETHEDYVAVLDSTYDLIQFDDAQILEMFKNDDKAVCIAPFVYSNTSSLFPTCYAPKISDNIRVDLVELIPEESFVNTLYPFMLMGVYRKKTFQLGGKIDYKIKDFNVREYDCFARMWLMGYHTYMTSTFKVMCNVEFVPIIDRTYNRDTKILSSKLLSFYKNRGGNAGLRPFWWLNYKIIFVLKDVKPFLRKATIDFYTLVHLWTVEMGDVNDIL